MEIGGYLKKKQPKQTEIENLLDKMVTLRIKCETSKSNKLHTSLNDIQNQCIKQLNYLVEDRASKYKGFSNYEDLCQDGRLALYRALQTYKPEKGNFFWWANEYVKTKLSREANNHSTIKIPLKKAKDIKPHKENTIPIIVDSSNALEKMETHETSLKIKNAINKLPNKQKKIINLHFEMGLDPNNDSTAVKICKKMKISRMSFLKLLDKAKENLKVELSNSI